MEFDWDEANESHLAEHDVSPSEYEEVMRNGVKHVEGQEENGEHRVLGIGHTNAVRVLYVVWTIRRNLIRPITAFDASRKAELKYLANRLE